MNSRYPVVGFLSNVIEVTSVSIPSWVYNSKILLKQSSNSRSSSTAKESSCFSPLELCIAQRIGHTEVEVLEVTQRRGNSLKDNWEGELLINGIRERFTTEIEEIQSSKIYWAVYERTETMAGEPIIKIHEITDESENQTK